MKTYLVGGSVRNYLLRLPVIDNDWVVVGGCPDYFLKNNFKQVGKQFPVFLHPKTNEEYALARTEKKSGRGYNGFSVNFSSDITLEEDLYRRDLTINAIAQDIHGNFIDPFNGIRDLKLKVLKHISPSFSEDPLRVLRVARFLAALSHMGFQIASSTFKLMSQMVIEKELIYLEPYRIWKETEKALKTPDPHIYFRVLQQCGAIRFLFPELFFLWNIDHNTGFFFGSSFKKKMFLFNIASIVKVSNRIDVRFASLFQFAISNFFSRKSISYNHVEHYSIDLLKKFFKRLRVPSSISNLAIFTFKFHTFLINVYYCTSFDILKFFQYINAWRNTVVIDLLVILVDNYYCFFNKNYDSKKNILLPGKFLKRIFYVAKLVSVSCVIKDGFKGKEISEELFIRRKIAIDIWRKKNKNKLFF
ncbi:Multifunctional CCA protein [Buchnera aphidicola (Thelaxes suberi)]|uniref:tRNA CCA-pyrophosphorylase n=1 Tax=Buchnera aphidicola TaxID=9 RepID=UPI0034639F48